MRLSEVIIGKHSKPEPKEQDTASDSPVGPLVDEAIESDSQAWSEDKHLSRDWNSLGVIDGKENILIFL